MKLEMEVKMKKMILTDKLKNYKCRTRFTKLKDRRKTAALLS